MSILLNHETTEPEHRLRVEIIRFLERLHFSGEVHCRCFITNQKGNARRPDFYFPRYGLPIEVDGRTRDGWIVRSLDIEPRDTFYTSDESLGMHPPWVIPATWTANELKMNRFKEDFEKFLFTQRLTNRQQGTVNKRIHDGRKIFERRNPGIFRDSGTLAPQFIPELAHLKEYRHFGGTKFILRGKYKTRAIIEAKESETLRLLMLNHLGTDNSANLAFKFIIHIYNQGFDEDHIIYWLEEFAIRYGLDPHNFCQVVWHFKQVHP